MAGLDPAIPLRGAGIAGTSPAMTMEGLHLTDFVVILRL
jgi:hypothetical protein